jgi:hypothetical protein
LAGSSGLACGCVGSNLGDWPVDSSMIWYASSVLVVWTGFL